MAYRYNYGALMSANTTNNNFKPLSEVAGTADNTNMVNALLEAKGLTAGADSTNAVMAGLPDLQADSQVELFQNVAGLSESDTAVARGDTWGGSDDTMGKSWLEAVVAGTADVSGGSVLEQVNELYERGFVRDADTSGLTYWGGQAQYGGQSIQDIAKHFLDSEEATYRTGYHENYGRDADQAGLDYWLEENTAEQAHEQADVLANFNRILQHTGDEYEQKETSVRNRLSAELGLHSTDAQRLDDTSLHGADGVAGTADDVFTDASEADVFRMMDSGDLGASEVADKVKMQTAAQSMGDYGGGVDDVGATNIHRMLANKEMGTVVSEATGDKWVSDPTTLAKTAEDYLPSVEHTYDEDGNITSTTESNVWSLLKAGTQDYNQDDVDDVVDDITDDDDTTDDDTTDDDDTTNDDIVVTNDDVDVHTELTSDVEDTSSYGTSKAAFDNAAAGIDAPLQDMLIRNSQAMGVGGSAEGVRLKRSKKFKAGESALGTKQLGRQLQLKSLNI
tara:strand:+ start:1390 stop:2907 length:1518 start_codon:yes stop_codon:yes gene_type:complete